MVEADSGNMQWTAENEVHKLRRKPYNSFFSVQAVLKLEDLISESVNKLCELLRVNATHQQPSDLSVLYRCYLTDNICDYAFGRNMGFLDNPDKGREFFEFHSSFFSLGWLVLEMPWFFKTLAAIGPHLPAVGGVAAFIAFQKVRFTPLILPSRVSRQH